MAVNIAIVNQKGGVAKTTTAIELCACFENRGYKALLVDMDEQIDASKYMGTDYTKPGVYNVLSGEVNIKDAIQHTEEFDILSGSGRLGKADVEFSELSDLTKLKDAFDDIDDIYDFIVIDTHPARNKLLQLTLIATDYVIVPTDTDDGSIDGIRAVFNDVNEYRGKFSTAEVMGIVFARYEKSSVHSYAEEQIEEIIKEQNSDAFFMKVRKAVASSEAKAERQSLQKGKKNSNPAMDYRRVADEIIDRVLEESDEA